jgi:hypothetical protein
MPISTLNGKHLKHTQSSPSPQPLLKHLREKKKISRISVSKITQLSTYQVEGLEGQSTQKIIGRVLLYIKALGYKPNDLIHFMENGSTSHGVQPLKGTL